MAGVGLASLTPCGVFRGSSPPELPAEPLREGTGPLDRPRRGARLPRGAIRGPSAELRGCGRQK